MGLRGATAAAPPPTSSDISRPEDMSQQSKASDTSPSDKAPPESPDTPPESARSSDGDFQQFFNEAMAENAPKGEQTPEQQALQDLASQMRANAAVVSGSDVGRALNQGQDSASAHVQTTTTDAARQTTLDQASQQSVTQTRDTFERGVSADQSTAMRAFGDKQALESGQRYADARTGTDRGGQTDRTSDKVAKQSGEGSAQWQARMLKQSKPTGAEVEQRFQKMPNSGQLTPRQGQVVKEHLAKQMQMQKLQQMLDKAKAEGASKEEQQFLENMISKLKAETENPPEELAMAQGAEEAGETEAGEETEEADKTEEGKEAGESEGAEGLKEFEQVQQGADSGDTAGQQGGQMDQGAQLPAVLPPTVDSNLSLMQTLEARDDVFTTGTVGASPENQKAERDLQIGARALGVMGMGAGETYRLHGSNGFHAIRMRYHGAGHSLDPQFQEEIGQANVEQGGVRVVGHRSGVAANIYQLGDAMKGVDQGQTVVTYRGQQWSTAGIRRELHAAAMVRGFYAASVTPGRTQSLGTYNAGMIA